jgi:hypothetical protein
MIISIFDINKCKLRGDYFEDLRIFLRISISLFVYFTNHLINVLYCKPFSLPESFNKNISYQLFDYKITFVNSQRENTNLKGNFVIKNSVETFLLKISGKQK